MTEALQVFLDGEPIGLLEQSPGGASTFEYDLAHRSKAAATPLSLALPLARVRHKNNAVRPFLQGLLPDSPGRLDELAREHRVSANNPFALLRHVGRDAAGAVQILPGSSTSPDAAARRGDVSELDETAVSDLMSDLIANRDTWGRRTVHARWSLPGAQPKVALFRTPAGTWAVPNDSTPTTHILKPAVAPYPDHHVNEFMTMSAARHLGLSVAEDFLLVTERGDAVFVSERYDRVEVDGRWHRLHQEDLCQALGVAPDRKYEVDGGPSIARIARLFATLPDAEDRAVNATRFFDAIVFNLAAQGTDAHAKNYSLMLDGDRATLAPLYDLGSHAPYATRGGAPTTLAMSVEGEYRVDAIGFSALARVARRLGLDPDQAHDRARAITAGIVDAFQVAGDEAREQLGPLPFISEMVDSIAEYADGRGWTTPHPA